MNDFSIKYKVWLETDGNKGILGEGKIKLLKTIDQTGSLKSALEQQNLSYRKTWNNLKKIEETLGFYLIEKQRGGKNGGRTSLTPKGKIIIDAFDKFYKNYDSYIKRALQETVDEINKLI